MSSNSLYRSALKPADQVRDYCACRKLRALAKCPRTRESEETNSRGLLGAKGYRDSAQR